MCVEGGGGGGLCETNKKENLLQKSVLQIMLNEVLKSWEKWYIYISADVQANKNNK